MPPDGSEDLASKAGFPEVEKDTSPSAVLPGAIKAVQRQIKKLDGLLCKFPAPKAQEQEDAKRMDKNGGSNCLKTKFRGQLTQVVHLKFFNFCECCKS